MTNREKFKEVFQISQSQVDEGELYAYVWLPTHDAIEIPLEWWNAEYKEPTTKNDLGVDREDAVERLNALKQFIGYDKDSEIVKATQKSLDLAIKALEQEPTTKNDLGVDAISRTDAIRVASGYCHPSNIAKELAKLPPVAPQEPFKPMVEIDLYSVIKQKYIEREVLDKIRAEIAEYGSIWVQYQITGRSDKDIQQLVSGVLKQAKEQVLEIIDKYKAESENKE